MPQSRQFYAVIVRDGVVTVKDVDGSSRGDVAAYIVEAYVLDDVPESRSRRDTCWHWIETDTGATVATVGVFEHDTTGEVLARDRQALGTVEANVLSYRRSAGLAPA